MPSNNNIAVGDHVVINGDVYTVRALDGDMCVAAGDVTGQGALFTGRYVFNRRADKPTKVDTAFVNALKGTV